MDVKEPSELYRVLEQMRSMDAEIVSVLKPVEDLEEIFLRTLSENKDASA
jgi:hypothetical protein